MSVARAVSWCKAIGLGALVAAGASGCAADAGKGYSLNPSHNSAIKTVHVPIFHNPTFHRGIEVDLTDAIIKQIQTSTPWKVTSGGVADTALGGTITDVTMHRLSTNRGSGLSQELSVAITVDFDWTDARTGRTLASRRSFTAAETFVPSRPVGERLEVGEHAAVQQLARDIVAELRSNW